jgi:hypothetical protein
MELNFQLSAVLSRINSSLKDNHAYMHSMHCTLVVLEWLYYTWEETTPGLLLDTM